MYYMVDPESLVETAMALRDVCGFVGDWNRHKADLVASAPHAGHPTMSEAIDQFCREWDYGFGHIADGLEEIARALEAAAIAYEETDRAVAVASGAGE